jgi:hypothetical protein
MTTVGTLIFDFQPDPAHVPDIDGMPGASGITLRLARWNYY